MVVDAPDARLHLAAMQCALVDLHRQKKPRWSDTIDPDEVITAVAKTVAELTYGQDGAIRQQLIEQLVREIMDYDAEFRREAGTSAMGSDARH